MKKSVYLQRHCGSADTVSILVLRRGRPRCRPCVRAARRRVGWMAGQQGRHARCVRRRGRRRPERLPGTAAGRHRHTGEPGQRRAGGTEQQRASQPAARGALDGHRDRPAALPPQEPSRSRMALEHFIVAGAWPAPCPSATPSSLARAPKCAEPTSNCAACANCWRRCSLQRTARRPDATCRWDSARIARPRPTPTRSSTGR